ncbi:MAG: glycosyltransferase family 2 protein [Planctomycetaceae bacterium]|jgi:glycosyltransferase involved in cell wall biosynthesis|nr:glycosyltransferase family 2 protein [Planctomycetaceae bacterium]
MNDHTLVSLLLVVRNESTSVRQAILSLSKQTISQDQTEIIVVDGLSTDGTDKVVKRILEELCQKGWKCRFLENLEKTLAAGWNLGIRESIGDFICRIDAHATIEPDYIEKGICLLNSPERKKIVAVGGILKYTKNKTFFGNMITDLLGSRFGVGNSPFRIPPKKIIETDTAVFAVYRRKILLETGGFNENLKRNQDNEFHRRLADKGWKFLTDPDMRATYQPRSTFLKLMKQGFENGYWIVFSGGSLRHFIPFYFVLYLFIYLSIFIFIPKSIVIIALIPLMLYFFLGIGFAIKDGKSFFARFGLPVFYFYFHLAYGFGTLYGLICRVTGKKL